MKRTKITIQYAKKLNEQRKKGQIKIKIEDKREWTSYGGLLKAS